MKKRTLLMIPGPIEFEPAVLSAMGEPTSSHVDPEFIDAFGQALERLREITGSTDGQPFVLAGSGTLAMDTAGANLVERGDQALVISTGFFGTRFAAILERYGAEVTTLTAQPGGLPDLNEIEAELRRKAYKVVTITQVDTSTGVLADVASIARLGRQYGALVIVDGVCSVAGEELRMSDWDIDVVLTASQKAVGVPPGLALLVASKRAIDAFQARKSPVANYYADWGNWLPIMQAYEARRPSYFATPAVNLVSALNVSLGQILAEGVDQRVHRHKAMSQACKAAMQALGLGQVPQDPAIAAHTMTAPRYPGELADRPAFLKRVAQEGVVIAGGLHPAIKNEYFRIGHMGTTKIGDVLATVGAIESALNESGYQIEPGSGVAAAAAAYQAS